MGMDDSGCKEANERASCRCKKDGSVPVPVTGNTKCGDQDKTCFVMKDETNGKSTVEYDLKRALHINGVSTKKVKFSYPVKLDSNGVNQYNDSTLGLRIKGGFECGGRFSGKVYGDEEKRVPKHGIMGTDSGIDPEMTKLGAALDKWMYAEELQQCCVEHDLITLSLAPPKPRSTLTSRIACTRCVARIAGTRRTPTKFLSEMSLTLSGGMVNTRGRRNRMAAMAIAARRSPT